MKERGILFAAPMVCALLGGSKTQTRRVVKGQEPLWGALDVEDDVDGNEFFVVSGQPEPSGLRPILTAVRCPYGQPGDRLWVRETWHPDPEDDGMWAYTQWVGCKGSPLSDIPKRFQRPEHCIFRVDWTGSDLVWRPSIHMPRWASRILLEIVSVRVERLNDISEADAVAEGIGIVTDHMKAVAAYGMYYCAMPDGKMHYRDNAVELYKTLWEQLNGAGSWDANPWVWVVEFKRVAA